MGKEFQIPQNPTFPQISEGLATCSNNMARVSDLCAQYKADLALKTTKLKRAKAKAMVRFSGQKNATVMKAMAEVEPEVVKCQDEVDSAMAIYTIAQGEIEAWEAQFVALRKMVAIREIELRGNIG